MKKEKPDGGYERGWFGPMIITKARQEGVSWEYQVRFHTKPEGELYNDGAWIPRNNLKAAAQAEPREP